MGLKSLLIKPYARRVTKKVNVWKERPLEAQRGVFRNLVKIGSETAFGLDHDLVDVKTYEEFKERVPISDYEGLKPYVQRIIKGEKDVLWPRRPIYFAKTSGTTSGVKYIPITRDSIGNHFYTAQTAMMLFMEETGRYNIIDGRMIFLSGSPELDRLGGILTGRLSGIVNHQVPFYLKGNQLPGWKTNCIEEWETKLDHIVKETIDKDMRLISGIPPWVQMYFDRLIEESGKKVGELFPNFQAFVYGGVNYAPYKAKLEEAIGRAVPSVETYPASEGFIAFQDSQQEEGMLLNVESGIFYEFIPAEEVFNENPTRLSLEEVEVGVNYAIILNTNAGLWGYNIGDTVKFVSTKPYRLVVTGRIKHFISAFGEHVIAEEVEKALLKVANEDGVGVIEFTVAPVISSEKGESYHEWLVAFAGLPDNMENFAAKVDEELRRLNIYYDDLIRGKILKPLKITPLKKEAFIEYMRSKGKLGGQNKVPRLSNDRAIADELAPFAIR